MATGSLRKSIIKKYKKGVDKLRRALAAPIYVYYRTGERIECGSCVWDPVNKESLDPDCAECAGNHYRDEILVKRIVANTNWAGMSEKYLPIRTPAGTLEKNDVLISCYLKDALIDPSDLSGDTVFKRATKITINDIVVVPKTSAFPYGLGGELYSVGLIATLDDAAA